MLQSNVLVLNKSFLPVHVTSVRRAFCLLYAGLAKAVNSQYETFDFDSWRQVSIERNDETVGLVDRVIKVPRVILLIAYDRVPKRRIRFSRYNIFARDRNTCQYCGKKCPTEDLTFDHVIPVVNGGGKTWDNIVSCCFECNHKKGGRTPEEAGMRLIRQPKEPEWVPTMLHITIGFRAAPQAWRDYFYWNIELESET